jgi:hypothetical protein
MTNKSPFYPYPLSTMKKSTLIWTLSLIIFAFVVGAVFYFKPFSQEVPTSEVE